MSKEATGDEALAIRLGWFVRDYQPKCWIVPIHNVAFCPSFLVTDIEEMRKDFEVYLQKKDYPWYIVEAIRNFFADKSEQIFIVG